MKAMAEEDGAEEDSFTRCRDARTGVRSAAAGKLNQATERPASVSIVKKALSHKMRTAVELHLRSQLMPRWTCVWRRVWLAHVGAQWAPGNLAAAPSGASEIIAYPFTKSPT